LLAHGIGYTALNLHGRSSRIGRRSTCSSTTSSTASTATAAVRGSSRAAQAVSLIGEEDERLGRQTTAKAGKHAAAAASVRADIEATVGEERVKEELIILCISVCNLKLAVTFFIYLILLSVVAVGIVVVVVAIAAIVVAAAVVVAAAAVVVIVIGAVGVVVVAMPGNFIPPPTQIACLF
jgi:hypothetical protein